MPKVNKVVRIAISGGLIGAIFTNPRKALDDMIDKHNKMVGTQYIFLNIKLQIYLFYS